MLSVRLLAAVLVVLMTVTTFLTQRQLMSKNMPADALTGPYAQQQKMLLYVLPLVFAVGGIAFPIGVLFYWTTSNIWTMGQQFYVIRNNPAPGTPAETAKKERDARKAARKGILPAVEEEPEPENPTPPPAPRPELAGGLQLAPLPVLVPARSGKPHRGDRAGPEHLAQDGGVLEERLRGVGERVQARADDRLDRLGHGDLGAGVFPQHPPARGSPSVRRGRGAPGRGRLERAKRKGDRSPSRWRRAEAEASPPPKSTS